MTRGKNLLKLLRVGCSPEEIAMYSATLPQGGARQAQAQVVQKPVVLPREFEALSETRDVLAGPFWKYLARRGVREDHVALYRLGICRDGEFRGRVVFPSFDVDGDLNFFTGRSIDPGGSYRTCDGNKDIIFNEWMIDWREPVTVVEGPFDAVAAGTNSIALQGKNMLSKLRATLRERGGRVYVALDEDALKQQVKIMRDLYRYQVEVMVVNLSGKDPSEMGSEQFELARRAARPFDEMDRVRMLC